MEGFKILQGEQIAPHDSKHAKYVRDARNQSQEAARKIGQTGASITSALLGLPGDIAGGALGLTKYATGGATPSYGEVQEKLPISLPTSEQVRGGIDKVSGGFTQAQTPGEQTWDNIVRTATDLLVPFPTPGKIKAAPGLIKGAVKGLTRETAVKGLKKAGRAVAIAGAGEGASELAETLGAGEVGKTLAKLGTMGVASLFGGRSALTGRMKEGYEFSKEAAKDKMVKSDTIIPLIEKIEHELPKSYPAKEFIDARIKEIKGITKSESKLVDMHGKQLAKSEVPLSEVIGLKQGLNDYWKEVSKPSYPVDARKRLGPLIEALKKPIDEFAKENKQFGKYWHPSEDIYKGLMEQSAATQFLRKHVKLDNIKNSGLSALLGGGGWYVGGIPGAAAGLALGSAAREASRFVDFISKSKVARDAYLDTIKSAAKGSATGVARNIAKLDKIAETKNFSIEPEGFTIVSGKKL